MRLLLTGFGPFLAYRTNPSQVLAEGSGQPYEILEVSYRCVDEWVQALDPARFDGLLLLGLSAGSTSMNLERLGHNRTCRTPDVRGFAPRARTIEKGGPWRVPSNLWTGELGRASFFRTEKEFSRGGKAGGYLCNYLLYRTLRRFPDKRVGFLHVPPFERIDEARQREMLQALLSRLEASKVA